MPVDEIVKKITEKTGLSTQEIETKIKSKLEALSGLISKEGAIHIIANELGVDLSQARGAIKIKDVLPGMRSVEVNGKVIKKYELRKFDTGKRKGQLSKALIADDTTATIIVMWNEQAELINKFNEGDIIKIKGATVRTNNGKNELHLSESSEIEINPKGLNVVAQTRENNYSKPQQKKISELTEQDNNVEIFGTIVQVFDPKFFRIDPESGKRIKDEDGKPEAYGFVLNLFLDDGSDNIRAVLWKNQILNLIGVSEQEIIKYKDNPQEFEKIKTELLGMMVKFIGRVSKNDLFGRLEFIVNVVIRNVNPEEEIKNLDQKNPVKELVENKKSVDEQTSKQKEPVQDLEDDLLSLEDIEDLEEDL